MLTTILFVLLLNSSLIAQTAPKIIEIDLISAALNGNNIFELDLDKLTDLLGKPTRFYPPDKTENVEPGSSPKGARIIYHNLGIEFWLNHPTEDSKQMCRYFRVETTTHQDNESGQTFSSFVGNLSKGVSGEWKSKRIMEAFSEFNPKDVGANENAKAKVSELLKLIEIGRKFNAVPEAKMAELERSAVETISCIILLTKESKVGFNYDPDTKFIQSVYCIKKTL
ncbi:MAG: hypothetical protein U1G08_04765 [Verrucomicrobiota bacterium]